jgi:hypothetical protein
MTDFTREQLEVFFTAVPSPLYEVGVLQSDGCMRFYEQMHYNEINKLVPQYQAENVNGAHILIRPKQPHPFTFIDDLNPQEMNRLTGLGAAIVIESSPRNYQAWVRTTKTLDPVAGSRFAQILAKEFSADLSGASYRHFCRAPGFTNRKEKHKRTDGSFPWAKIIHADPNPPTIWTDALVETAINQVKIERLRTIRRINHTKLPAFTRLRSIADFHIDPKYQADLHRADFAYALYAARQGKSFQEIVGDILAARDLSHKGKQRQQMAYASFTARRAMTKILTNA